MSKKSPKTVLIMGAAGRDFHNFNLVYRDDPDTEVVAFTAAQIPDIAGRSYPASLAGPLYPDGIPILEETHLESIITDKDVQQVLFAYSRCAPWRAKRGRVVPGRRRRGRMAVGASDSERRRQYASASDTPSSHLRECCVASTERSNGVAKRHGRRAAGAQ